MWSGLLQTINRWQAMAVTGAFEPLAEDLMALHYDPRYAKQRSTLAKKIGLGTKAPKRKVASG
jgi:hypothetical protein